MSLLDLPLPILFLLFFWFFMLVGIYPLWKRVAARLRQARAARGERRRAGPEVAAMPDDAAGPSDQLDDFAIFLLRRLAQDAGKGISRRKLMAELHFEPPVVDRGLRALVALGLVAAVRRLPFGTRFRLTHQGHEFAVAQGFIPRILEV